MDSQGEEQVDFYDEKIFDIQRGGELSWPQ